MGRQLLERPVRRQRGTAGASRPGVAERPWWMAVVACAERVGVQEVVRACVGWYARGARLEGVLDAEAAAAVRGAEPWWMADAYEAMLGAASRQRNGAFYTPGEIARGVVEIGLGASGRLPERVLDPACGTGRFLLAAVEALVARGVDRVEATRRVHGIDIDRVALSIARVLLWWGVRDRVGSPAEFDGQLTCGDALSAVGERVGRFGMVVGNPPFLNQLESATARARGTGLAGGYTDTSGVFLARGLEWCERGGVVAMIQPQSVLSARDAGVVRREVAARGRLAGLWIAGEGVFEAATHVCAPVIVVGDAGGGAVQRALGPQFARLEPSAAVGGETWGPLVADVLGVPRVEIGAAGVLGDWAEATADFRDQYYGLRGAVVEDDAGSRGRGCVPLVTTGLVDPAVCLWGGVERGGRGTRFDKVAFGAPRVDLAVLGRDPALARWARARLVPKVLLATQTAVIECVVDARGEWLPAVPLVTIVPRRGEDVWLVAAVLLSPAVSAEALRRVAGSGLSREAIKLSAKQAMQLPAPRAVTPSWRRAAELVRRAHAAGVADPTGRRRLLREAAEESMEALEVPREMRAGLMAWWWDRVR